MHPRVELLLPDLQNEEIVFWSSGNCPTQGLHNLSTSEVLLHLKALYLLCDRIVAAGSYYFESQMTRDITQQLQILFEHGDIVYFVNDSIEDFLEHGLHKLEKSPSELACYQDRDFVQENAKALNSLGYILRRPSHSISDKIVELWIRDVFSKRRDSIGYYLLNPSLPLS